MKNKIIFKNFKKQNFAKSLKTNHKTKADFIDFCIVINFYKDKFLNFKNIDEK